MSVCIRAIIIALTAMMVLSATGQAQFLRLDPRLEWWVLETEHFSIIFPPGTEGLAWEAAELAEEAWRYWKEERSEGMIAETVLRKIGLLGGCRRSRPWNTTASCSSSPGSGSPRMSIR